MSLRSILPCACACFLWLIAGCESNPPAPNLGSDTNWLRACTSDTECGSSACRCGLCTRSCTKADDCGAVADGRLCIEAGELSETSCRVAFSEAVSGGFCSQHCTHHTDCGASGGSTAFCVEGTCLPAGAMTPRGSVGSIVADAGAPPVSVTGSGGTNAGGTDAAVQGAGVVEDASVHDPLGDAGRLHGRADLVDPSGFHYEVLNPLPECPCQSDLPADAPLPVQGEVPTNAYGGPQPPAKPADSPLEGGEYYLRCTNQNLPEWWFTAETECVRYQNCPIACKGDADCPDGKSGSAAPRCSTTGQCYLDCQQARACPDGMACVSGQDGAACFWPREVLAPGCAAYCRQSPPPRDCDDWCADLLIACDPDNGVPCCEGLRCTEGGYCDEAP